MASTHMEDAKFIWKVLIGLSASRTGLIMTPPPMPQVAPAQVANNITSTNTASISFCPISARADLSSSLEIFRLALEICVKTLRLPVVQVLRILLGFGKIFRV